MIARKMEDGFYPALGTPTDNEGKLDADSYNKQIELMLDAGASGVLCMGSMGKMSSIRDGEYPNIAKVCTNTVSGRVPVLVGVMDCSVQRVIDRIEKLGDMEIDGVVATVPYYYVVNQAEIIHFFEMLSARSGYPVYIYDLPGVTQSPITPKILETLAGKPNIKGIKTANLNLILDMERNARLSDDFSVFYSGLDTFDIALNSGIGKNLDGMFTCTPYNSQRMYGGGPDADRRMVQEFLNNIIRLRNIFMKGNLFSAYSYAMELLGCPGNYQSDYDLPVPDKLKDEINEFMKEVEEI